MTDPGPASGANAEAPATPTDVVVIGAGPIGLFQVFELGLLGLNAHVIDCLGEPGGQCMALYPDKPIYDIPGTPRCTGRELVERLMRQLAPFAPQFHLNQLVSRVQPRTDGRFLIETSARHRLLARAVIIAAGVGAFQPRRLKVEGLAPHEGSQVFHADPGPERFAGLDLVIAGDGQPALEQAIRYSSHGANRPRSVTLMHRRDEFKAEPETIARMRQRVAQGQLRLLIAQPSAACAQGDRLRALTVLASDGTSHEVALDALLVCLGLSPKLGPIAEWGLALEQKQLVVDTERYQTSVAGIFAVGDVNTYPGKQKLIVCGFHEATLAAFGAARHVHPDRAIRLEYTTTSPRLHRALQVQPPG